MTIDFTWNYGFAVGIIIAEEQFKESYGLAWGFSLLLGPISFIIEKALDE